MMLSELEWIDKVGTERAVIRVHGFEWRVYRESRRNLYSFFNDHRAPHFTRMCELSAQCILHEITKEEETCSAQSS